MVGNRVRTAKFWPPGEGRLPEVVLVSFPWQPTLGGVLGAAEIVHGLVLMEDWRRCAPEMIVTSVVEFGPLEVGVRSKIEGSTKFRPLFKVRSSLGGKLRGSAEHRGTSSVVIGGAIVVSRGTMAEILDWGAVAVEISPGGGHPAIIAVPEGVKMFISPVEFILQFFVSWGPSPV